MPAKAETLLFVQEAHRIKPASPRETVNPSEKHVIRTNEEVAIKYLYIYLPYIKIYVWLCLNNELDLDMLAINLLRFYFTSVLSMNKFKVQIYICVLDMLFLSPLIESFQIKYNVGH